ncbi:Conserved hypothetical protein [Prochlorococcus marinus str. MIT 9303]|uniref:Uncharacterized protein n=1 Tax=Prochlorococcus marinus (strain MIT 9303) TaxID=59922 RepID=A2C9N9_PROM3|nr:Conserved hypothetical protein [Prochlorococcus marinus str. MIT 9303]
MGVGSCQLQQGCSDDDNGYWQPSAFLALLQAVRKLYRR